jgi:hypothetical protein
MKSTEAFKTVIQNHLNETAANDPLFAETLKKENKNIDQCINYILQTVQKSGCSGFADEEIFGMAKHYYDEDSINEKGNVNCKVVVNHVVELSEDDIAKAKQDAKDKIISQEMERMKKKSAPKKDEPKESVQPTLF